MLEFTSTVTKDEYFEAQKLYVGYRQKRATVLVFAMLFILLLACAALFFMTGGLMSAITASAFLCGLWVIIYFIAKPLTHKLVLGMRFRQDAHFLTNAHIVISDEGVEAETFGLGNGTVRWVAFTGWFEGRNVFVLVAGYTIRPIPKRLLRAPEQDELRALLTQHIGPANTIRRF